MRMLVSCEPRNAILSERLQENKQQEARSTRASSNAAPRLRDDAMGSPKREIRPGLPSRKGVKHCTIARYVYPINRYKFTKTIG